MLDVSKLFLARSILLTMLASATLPAQETDEHPGPTSDSLTSVELPSMDYVMARFKEIESSYLPFHVKVIETRGLRNGNADFGAARHSLEDGYRRMQYAFRNGQSWMQESTFIARGRIATTNRITCSGGSIVRLPHQAVNDGSVANPLAGPMAGLFPLMSHPEYPTLVSDLYKSNPARFTMQRDGNIARVMIAADAVDRDSQRVELWLSEAHKWHPIRMQRFANTSDKSIEADWAITTLRVSEDTVRIAAGRFSSAWGRLKQGEDQTAAVFVVTDFEVEASAYGDQVFENVFSSDTLPGQSALESFQPEDGSNVFVFVPSNNAGQDDVPILITDVTKPADASSEDPLAEGVGEKPTADAHAPFQARPGMNGGGSSLFGGGRSGSRSSSVYSPPSTAPVSTAQVDDERLKFFHLQNGSAKQASQVIEQLFVGASMTVAVDERTNSLIVRSSEPFLQQIESILLRLDEQPGKQTPNVNSVTGPAADSMVDTSARPSTTADQPIVPIAEYRRLLSALELPLLQLAEKVRSTEVSLGKDHMESVKHRASLRESIQKTFAARQEIQRAELAEFTRRLQRMEQLIDTRDRIAEQIVERRIQELLDTRPERETAVKESGKSRMLNAQDAADGPSKSTKRFKKTSVTANVTRTDSSPSFDEQAVLYGFPLDKTNRVIFVQRAKLSEDDLESIAVDLGDFVFPAKVIASNPAQKMLLVQVSADITFDSVPLATEQIKIHQRVQLGGHSSFGEEVVVADVKPDSNIGESERILTDASFGISDTDLILNKDGTQLLGLGIGENTIIPAPEISKWLNATISTIGVDLISDRNLDLKIAGEPTRLSSTSSNFDIRSDKTSQVQLSRIHGADDLEVRLTIEPRFSTPEARQFLQRHTMTISVNGADVNQLNAGKMVIKVLYVRPGSSNVSSISGVSAIANSDVDAGTDPADVAAEYGTVIGVVRMSRIDPGSEVSVSE